MKKDIEKDILKDFTAKPKVFLASNGYDRGIRDVSAYGELIRLTERRIDPHLNFETLRQEVYKTLDTYASNGDYLLIGNCSITLLLAFTWFSEASLAKVLFYDQLTHDFQVYELNGASWTTTPTPMK